MARILQWLNPVAAPAFGKWGGVVEVATSKHRDPTIFLNQHVQNACIKVWEATVGAVISIVEPHIP